VTGSVWAFYGFSLLAVVGAVGTVANARNLVASAMALVVTMISLAGIYALLGAHLVAVFQIALQGGAVVSLFLFTTTLLDAPSSELPPARHRLAKVAALVLAIAALTAMLRSFTALPDPPSVPAGFGGTRTVAIALFTDYVLLVEVVSLVLLAAIVGGSALLERERR
jgi:NADH-quinone oxidoreductase subunit J